VAQGLASLVIQDSERAVAMENPAGILRARVYGRLQGESDFAFPWVAYERNAQLFMDGMFPIHRPSEALQEKARALA